MKTIEQLIEQWRVEAGLAETEASDRFTRLRGPGAQSAYATAAKCLRACADELEAVELKRGGLSHDNEG